MARTRQILDEFITGKFEVVLSAEVGGPELDRREFHSMGNAVRWVNKQTYNEWMYQAGRMGMKFTRTPRFVSAVVYMREMYGGTKVCCEDGSDLVMWNKIIRKKVR